MDLNQWHFAHSWCLWGMIAIPLVWALFFFFYQARSPSHQLEKFIDSHLLPYLLVGKSNKERSFWKTLALWSSVWCFFVVACAGPSWSFREMETFSKDQSLVILLDLSESMNATDIKPSRLVRAKQKIEDLINLSKQVKVGLVAFAADPHMISPVTEDKEMIRHLLPSLETDLIYVQGSRLSIALDMASTMLEREPGSNKSILVISDGGFEDASAIATAKKLAEGGFTIHSMGIGSLEGAPLKDHKGNIVKKSGVPILSKLEKEKLKGISEVGNGQYLEAHYSDHDEIVILNELDKRANAQANIAKKSKFWDERFYLFILPTLPILLLWFRRGYVFSILFIFIIPTFHLEALSLPKNSEEMGKEFFDAGDYEKAIEQFKDPYRKGVAYYKAGQFAEAEKMFQLSHREDVALNAEYNLGNALAQQEKFKEAIATYEDLLKKWPDYTKAKENLELVKKMLKEQEKDSSKTEGSDSQKGENKEDSKEEKEDSEKDQKKDSSEKKEEDSSKDEREEQAPQDSKELNQPEEKEPETKAVQRSQEDMDADVWLNQISNDPKTFLKNKFYIESKKNGTTAGIDPW